jgi:hypothetical protein
VREYVCVVDCTGSPRVIGGGTTHQGSGEAAELGEKLLSGFDDHCGTVRSLGDEGQARGIPSPGSLALTISFIAMAMALLAVSSDPRSR